MYKLTKALLKPRCIISPKYVTNGFFVIEKSLIVDAPLFLNCETVEAVFKIPCTEMTDEKLEKAILPIEKADIEYKPLPLFTGIEKSTDYAQVYQAGNSITGIRCQHIKAFGIQDVYGNMNALRFGLWCNEKSIYTMPVNVYNELFLDAIQKVNNAIESE